ncbi:unnamed protein product [Closterium sp. NIES-53]
MSQCFFRDHTTVTPLAAPVLVALADPSSGPANLVGVGYLQDHGITVIFPAHWRNAICMDASTGAVLAMFTREPHSGLLVLHTPPPHVVASGQVTAPGQGWLRATPHSSSLRPATTPFQTLHLDVWGLAPRLGSERERYFLVVVDDFFRYTMVFPLAKKSKVTSTLIRWLLVTKGTRVSRVRCLHSDRGGELCSDVLAGFCGEQGITQSWTLPESPQQNGVVENHIGLVMEIDRTSMIHAHAPHFLWPYPVRYAAHQLNLWPRVSRPGDSPTNIWTGSPGVASDFHVWGSLALVRDTSADKLSARAIPCVFLGFPVDSPDFLFYHPPLHRFLDSRDVRFDESMSYYTQYPCTRSGGARSRGAGAGGAGTGGASSGGAGAGGASSGGAGAGGAGTGGASFGGAGAGGAGTGGAVLGGAGAGVAISGVAGAGGARTEGASTEETGARGTTIAAPTTPPHRYDTHLQALCRVEPGAAEAAAVAATFTAAAAPAAAAGADAAAATFAAAVPSSEWPSGPWSSFLSSCPLTVSYRVRRHRALPLSVLPPPLASSLTVSSHPITDYYRVLCPVLSRALASLVTDPYASTSSVSALTAAIADFAATRRLEFATCFELEFLAAASPSLCAMLLYPKGDPDALDIPTPRMYREAVSGTYVGALPPPKANVVDGMWIFKVKRPPRSAPVFKARYMARGFIQREGVDFFKTFAQTSKMTTLRVLLHVVAQRDYESRSTTTLSQPHMVQQVLQRFGLQHSTTQPTPLAVDLRLTGPFPDEPFEPSGLYTELVGFLIAEAEIYAGAMVAQELCWLTFLLTDLGE